MYIYSTYIPVGMIMVKQMYMYLYCLVVHVHVHLYKLMLSYTHICMHPCCCVHLQWCLFLQERIVTEIYSLAMTERNQQALCQVRGRRGEGERGRMGEGEC